MSWRQADPQRAALTTAVTGCSATAMLFGSLAWRVGVCPELLADGALAVVCAPSAAIDLVERRMPAKLLLPAYISYVEYARRE